MITIEQVIEQCARECDQADKSTHPADLADAIRALAAQYERCIVAEGKVERYQPVAHTQTDSSKRWEYIPLYRAWEAK